ncbi:acetyltransferase (GNAT) family protein [Archangium gephyra]|uniref:Acetyltransferase (GNAT) family protein n=1 Tax=Archangium gephyra TaxID=48 RepID=A0AAC8PZV6_9BACT|nr:GNAT family N-acetyltransferase [Archangium gephyra]AKI98408.1 GCN5-related N-acetyltransferase [Archangium gephyra]REG20492.1 acetyltransferase (GNAT) family protein [Archangium gephyra]
MEIRTIEASDQAAVLDTLTLAFATDPVTRYWWPGASDYLRWWPQVVFAQGERGFEHRGVSATERFEGVAMWLPPGVHADPARMAALDMPGTEEDEAIAGELRVEMQRHHPAQPHWYLLALGVDPRFQGRGVGSALLRHTLARIDAEGAPAYLEASNPTLIPFYERHGFKVAAVIEVRDVPPLTPMFRPGRA